MDPLREALAPRQFYVDDTNTTFVDGGFVDEHGRHYYSFWYTRTGLIVKWSLFLAFLVILTLYLTVGYWHAKKRIRNGQRPLAYHRWLVNRQDLARVDPRYAYPAPLAHGYNTYRPAEYYNMQATNGANMPPPPPMYDPYGRPPVYEPPMGGTKTAADQGQTYRPAEQRGQFTDFGGGAGGNRA